MGCVWLFLSQKCYLIPPVLPATPAAPGRPEVPAVPQTVQVQSGTQLPHNGRTRHQGTSQANTGLSPVVFVFNHDLCWLLSFNRPLPSNISLSCLDQHALAELCFTYCHTDPVTGFVKPKGTTLQRSRPLGGQKTCVSESIYKHLPYVTNKVSCHWTPWSF